MAPGNNEDLFLRVEINTVQTSNVCKGGKAIISFIFAIYIVFMVYSGFQWCFKIVSGKSRLGSIPIYCVCIREFMKKCIPG